MTDRQTDKETKTKTDKDRDTDKSRDRQTVYRRVYFGLSSSSSRAKLCSLLLAEPLGL